MMTRTSASALSAVVLVCIGAWYGGRAALTPHGPPELGTPHLAMYGPPAGFPNAAPTIGADGKPIPYAVYLPVSNPGPGALQVQVAMHGGPSEVVYSLSGFSIPAGSFGNGIVVGQVVPRRTRPVVLHLSWHRGASSGSQTYTIPDSGEDSTPSHVQSAA